MKSVKKLTFPAYTIVYTWPKSNLGRLHYSVHSRHGAASTLNPKSRHQRSRLELLRKGVGFARASGLLPSFLFLESGISKSSLSGFSRKIFCNLAASEKCDLCTMACQAKLYSILEKAITQKTGQADNWLSARNRRGFEVNPTTFSSFFQSFFFLTAFLARWRNQTAAKF